MVEEYTRIKPNNPLASYLPALRKVRGKGDVFTGLSGFEAVVKSLAKDQGGCRVPSTSSALCGPAVSSTGAGSDVPRRGGA